MEFKLTDTELFLAYQEQEHTFDCENIKSEVEAKDEYDLEDQGISKEALMAMVDQMAYDMRHEMDKYGYPLEDARSIAISKNIEKIRDGA